MAGNAEINIANRCTDQSGNKSRTIPKYNASFRICYGNNI